MTNQTEKKPVKLTEKQDAFCLAYFTPGSETFGNGQESARTAGYDGNDATLSQVAYENLNKPDIAAMKAVIQAETRNTAEITRETLISKLTGIIDGGKTASNRDKISSISLIADLCGFKREAAPNAERVAARKANTDTERTYLKELAEKRTADKARESVKLSEVG